MKPINSGHNTITDDIYFFFTGAPAAYYGAPPTSSVGPRVGAGPGASYHQPPPPTSSYHSYPPPQPGPGGAYGGQPSGPPPGIDPELWTWFQVCCGH